MSFEQRGYLSALLTEAADSSERWIQIPEAMYHTLHLHSCPENFWAYTDMHILRNFFSFVYHTDLLTILYAIKILNNTSFFNSFCDTEIPHTCLNEMTILIWNPTECVTIIIGNTDHRALTQDSIQQEAGCINSTEFHIQLGVYWLYHFLNKILPQWVTLGPHF